MEEIPDSSGYLGSRSSSWRVVREGIFFSFYTPCSLNLLACAFIYFVVIKLTIVG